MSGVNTEATGGGLLRRLGRWLSTSPDTNSNPAPQPEAAPPPSKDVVTVGEQSADAPPAAPAPQPAAPPENTPAAAPAAPSAPPPAPEKAAPKAAPPEKMHQRSPVIAILVDGPVGGGFFGGNLPIHVTGGSTGQYAKAIEEAGGTVKFIHDNGRSPADLLKGVDGLVVPGGRDVNPEQYGQKPKMSAGLRCGSMEFDVFEIKMLKTALEDGMPIRGICRGHQLLNVALNGTLMQDIRDHMDRPFPYTMNHVQGDHSIAVLPQTRTHAILGDDLLRVNSYHHQAVDKLGDGLIATARAADGVIEAIEKRDDPTVMGVQFHPERAGDGVRRNFFNALMADARAYRQEAGPAGPDEWQLPNNATERQVLLATGIQLLDQLGYEINFGKNQLTPASIAKCEESSGTFTLRYRRNGGHETILSDLTANRTEELLLSMTMEGRQELDKQVQEALELNGKARRIHGESLPSPFSRKAGMLSKEQPIRFDIETAWALQDGQLHLQGTRVDDIKGLRKQIQAMEDEKNKPPVQTGGNQWQGNGVRR